MTWRLAQDGDLAAIHGLLNRNVVSSMFLLVNLRDHGLGGTAPKAMQVWIRGTSADGVAGITNDGTLLIQAGAATAADWQHLQQRVDQRLAETNLQQVGVLGETEQLRRYLAATGLDRTPMRLNRD